jgi:hypothetical protein
MILRLIYAIYDHSFIVQATVITIVKYDRKTFIAQAADLNFLSVVIWLNGFWQFVEE